MSYYGRLPREKMCDICGSWQAHRYFDGVWKRWLCEPGFGHRTDEPELHDEEFHAQFDEKTHPAEEEEDVES